MVDVIANSAGISVDDLDNAPFTERGGVAGAARDLGPRASELITTLNRDLPA
jgi:type I restriction enzyme R subunit